MGTSFLVRMLVPAFKKLKGRMTINSNTKSKKKFKLDVEVYPKILATKKLRKEDREAILGYI